MLGLYKIVILLHILDTFAECSYPRSLSVRKLNRHLVARKRQNTLDLCRMFNVENEKSQDVHSRQKRVKRSAAALQDHAEKIENLVDKLYDDDEVNGEKVAYRKQTNTTPKPELVKSGRRFDFAPGILEVDLTGNKESTLDDDKKEEGGKSVPVIWHKYWKHAIIPYFIDSNTYDTFLAQKITKAFSYFEQTTCVRLQRLRERPTDKDSLQNAQWLYITNPSGTRQCVHSNEMKATSGVQWVVFGYDCMSEGEILHEIMHILGFSHEHVREDRDQYVSVMWDNVKPGYKKFFEIKQRPAILSSLPYDYSSVLHYPPRAFSKNGKFTLVAESGIVFGQREGLSDIDVEKVSMIYGGECMDRNKHYLLTTCPTVMATKIQQKPEKATQQEINDYFQDKIWPYGIVNYRLKDKIEFSIEERQNIEEVIKHIEKETCIEFRDLSPDEDAGTEPRGAETADDGNQVLPNDENEIERLKNTLSPDNAVEPKDNEITDSDGNKITNEDAFTNVTATAENIDNVAENIDNDAENNKDNAVPEEDKPSRRHKPKRKLKAGRKASGAKHFRRVRRALPPTPSRRHADDVLVLTRSPEPGCRCPDSGRPSAQRDLVINADCFNSVNDLLHLFVHVLGLDHQHNMHDRDDFLAINWTNISKPLREEMENKLPPAASVGFAYDYQSVMHYPWLDIKNGVTNIMYPIWNDGWAMGHWQGLSSIDVQKLNLLYFEQCQARKKHIARRFSKQ